MSGFDVRAWNLFAAMAVALPACADAAAEADDSVGTWDDDDDYDDWYPPCGDELPDGSFRCSDYDTYGDGDGDGDGDYECADHGECGPGSVCMDGSCVVLGQPLPSCDVAPGLVESIPVPADAAGAIALSQIDRNGDGIDELVIDTQQGLRWVDPIGGTVEALPVEATLGGHATASGGLDASTPDDLVLVDRVTGSMSLLRNDGAGGWSGPNEVGDSVGNAPIVPGDLDGDGALDVYVGGAWHRGDGSGGFASPQPVAGFRSHGPAVRIDADADAADELLSVREDGLAAFWDGQWGLHPLEPEDACPLPATDLAAADVDGDGRDDVLRLVDDHNTSVLSVFLVANAFASPMHFGLAIRHVRIEVGDLDGNEIPDVIGWGGPDLGTRVYWNIGDVAACVSTADFIAADMELADYDGDGRAEVAITDGSTMWILGVE